MKYYRLNYRKSYYVTDYKLVKTELGESDAIRRTKLKPGKITEIFELTQEEYEMYSAKKKAAKGAKIAAQTNAFIQ